MGFLSEKRFWLNVVISGGVVILSALLIFQGFSFYTRHNSSVDVPDLTGMSLDEAKKELKKRGLILEATDSLYDIPGNLKDKNIEYGDIVAQHPQPGEKVKKGRRFYLTIRSSVPSMVNMPNLVDLSLH